MAAGTAPPPRHPWRIYGITCPAFFRRFSSKSGHVTEEHSFLPSLSISLRRHFERGAAVEDIRGQFSYQKTKDPLDSVFSPPSLFLNSSVLKDENEALFAEEAGILESGHFSIVVQLIRRPMTTYHHNKQFSNQGFLLPSVGVKEGLSCVIFRAIVARKTHNLALPSLPHSVHYLSYKYRFQTSG